MKPRPSYDVSIKQECGLRFLNGESLRSLSEEKNIHYNTLKFWKRNNFYLSNYDAFGVDRTLFYMRVGAMLYGFERVRIRTPRGDKWALVLVNENSALPMKRYASWYI